MTTQPDRTHEQVIEASTQVHEQRMALVRQDSDLCILRRQQLARLFVIAMVVSMWLAQTAYVTYFAVKMPEILTDIEKFIALIAVTGTVAATIIFKLWPQSE